MSERPIKKGRIRQHFVPQFHLRNFGEKIHCYDKKKEKKFTSDPKNVAVKNDFHGGEFEEKTSIETIFAKIENRHSSTIKNY